MKVSSQTEFTPHIGLTGDGRLATAAATIAVRVILTAFSSRVGTHSVIPPCAPVLANRANLPGPSAESRRACPFVDVSSRRGLATFFVPLLLNTQRLLETSVQTV